MREELNTSAGRILKSSSIDFKFERKKGNTIEKRYELFNSLQGSTESDFINDQKPLNQLFEIRDKEFRRELDNMKISIEIPILYKRPKDKEFKKYHLSYNNIYFVLYKELTMKEIHKQNKKNSYNLLKTSSSEYINESGINLYLKNTYDIYHPILCLNFSLLTSFLTTNEENQEIIITILSKKPIRFKLKPISDNKEIYLKLLIILQSSITNSRGYHYNLLGISLLKDFYTNYYMKVAQFEYKAKTGDLLLFKGFDCPSNLQRCYTRNEYDHIALLCRKHGILYVYEATSKDGCKQRQWIQFMAYFWNLLYEKMVYRELIIKAENETIRENILNELNEKVDFYVRETHGKDYKMYICSIICGSTQKKSQRQNKWKNKPGFICSSLVMGAYLSMGLCEYKKNVNEILPGYFSQEGEIELYPEYELGPEIILDFST